MHVPSSFLLQQISPLEAFAKQSRLGRSYQMRTTSSGGDLEEASYRMPSTLRVPPPRIFALTSIQYADGTFCISRRCALVVPEAVAMDVSYCRELTGFTYRGLPAARAAPRPPRARVSRPRRSIGGSGGGCHG